MTDDIPNPFKNAIESVRRTTALLNRASDAVLAGDDDAANAAREQLAALGDLSVLKIRVTPVANMQIGDAEMELIEQAMAQAVGAYDDALHRYQQIRDAPIPLRPLTH